MMKQARRRMPEINGHHQGPDNQGFLHSTVHCPVDHFISHS
jgi:hypothetical protein